MLLTALQANLRLMLRGDKLFMIHEYDSFSAYGHMAVFQYQGHTSNIGMRLV